MATKSPISFVLRGRNRLKVLEVLSGGKSISRQIEQQTGIYKSHVSRTLKELHEWKLIKCLNPDDRDYRFYSLTTEGKKVLRVAKGILKDIGN